VRRKERKTKGGNMRREVLCVLLLTLALFGSGCGKRKEEIAPDWRVETVDSEGDVGYDSSLAIDAQGRPHVSYYDATSANLKYAFRDGFAWQVKVVDSTGAVGSSSSLALDTAGHPHISYNSDRGLRYAWFNGTIWQVETVGYDEHSGHGTSLALDSEGKPHISYFFRDRENNEGHLRYAHWSGEKWHVETIDKEPGYYSAAHSSLALDAENRPHICYSSRISKSIKEEALLYAHFDGTAWNLEVVDDEIPYTADSSLVVDAEGRPHISYRMQAVYGEDHKLKYFHRDDAGWHSETVDSSIYPIDLDGGTAPSFTSLALDSAGQPHIVFNRHPFEKGRSPDARPNDLMYAHHDGIGWRIETVSSGTGFAYWVSLALDSDDQAHITCYDRVNGDLKYFRREGSSAGAGVPQVTYIGVTAVLLGGVPARSFLLTARRKSRRAKSAQLSQRRRCNH
jgi:hypothetical protein